MCFGGRARASKPAPSTSAPRSEPRGEWPPAPPEGASHPAGTPGRGGPRAKAKQKRAKTALAGLNPTDQYLLLIELLADLHAYGMAVRRRVAAQWKCRVRSANSTTLSQPPPPALSRVAEEQAEQEEVEEPKPRASRAKAARPKAAATKSRSRALVVARPIGPRCAIAGTGTRENANPAEGSGNFRKSERVPGTIQRRAANTNASRCRPRSYTLVHSAERACAVTDKRERSDHRSRPRPHGSPQASSTPLRSLEAAEVTAGAQRERLPSTTSLRRWLPFRTTGRLSSKP